MAVQTINGVDLVLKSNDVEIGCAQDIDVTITTATSGATCRASGGWKQTVAGEHSWTASTSGLIRIATGTDAAGNVTYKSLRALQISRTPVELTFGSDVVGDEVATGMAVITETVATSPISGAATFTVSFEGDGPLTFSTNS